MASRLAAVLSLGAHGRCSPTPQLFPGEREGQVVRRADVVAWPILGCDTCTAPFALTGS
ncbi:hypothetical protein QPX29_10245 [Corynebacterium accolens]|uniref:hypothetical protein n=1 Tax=Corynebacterium accolens TaxID=38284 RepID=UPI001EDC635F|nr:hypothetical protein [Corynebacterium accolens]MDK4209673.1 hypothetical protein [Corynebacterium accolens]